MAPSRKLAPIKEQHADAAVHKKSWRDYMPLICTTLAITAGFLGWAVVTFVFIPLSYIPEHAKSLAVLAKMPEQLTSHEERTRKDFARIDEKIDAMSVDVAALKTLPPRVDLIVQEVRNSASRSASLNKSDSDLIQQTAKKVDGLEALIGKASGKIDGLASNPPEPQRVERLTSTAIRVPLVRPSNAGDLGKYHRAKYIVSTADLPILGDQARLPACTISSAVVGSDSDLATDVARWTLEASFDKGESMLVMVLWYDGDEKRPYSERAGLHAVVTVSWPERR